MAKKTEVKNIESGYRCVYVNDEMFLVAFTSVVDSNSFFLFGSTNVFRIRIQIRIRILRLTFWSQIFPNGASNCFHTGMCSGTCTYVREKNFTIEKHNFFLFQVFNLRFFTRFFILQQCLNRYPNPIFFSDSDSDPAKIRIHNTGIHSVIQSLKLRKALAWLKVCYSFF
jgi:hypothetical protein